MELYERIEAMCRQHGVTITEMCRDAGISRASVSDLKHGRSRFLSSATIHKMSNYFRVPMDFWYDGLPDPEPKEDQCRQNADHDTDEDFYESCLHAFEKFIKVYATALGVSLGIGIGGWIVLLRILLKYGF